MDSAADPGQGLELKLHPEHLETQGGQKLASIHRVFVRHVAPLGMQGDLPDVNTNSARRTVVSERIPPSKYPWVKLAGSHQSLLEPAFTKTNQRLKHVMNEF